MKKLMNFSCVAILLFTLATSCTKDKNAPKPVAEANRSITAEQMANPQNPFDRQGVIHNEFLDFYIQNTDPGQKLTQKEAVSLFQKFSEENQLEGTQKNKEAFLVVYQGSQERIKIGGLFDDFLCKYFPALCRIINHPGPGPTFPGPIFLNGLDMSNKTTARKNVMSFIKQIKTTEGNIVNSKKGRQYSKADTIQLLYCAIARYSSAYWYNAAYVQTENNPWIGTLPEAQLAEFCWGCIIEADATGAAVGYALGGPIAGPVISGELSGLFSAMEFAYQFNTNGPIY